MSTALLMRSFTSERPKSKENNDIIIIMTPKVTKTCARLLLKSKIHILDMTLLGTKSVNAAFALMAEATRRSGEYGNYNSFIRAIPSIPHLADEIDPKTLGTELPQMVKFIIYQYLSKSGRKMTHVQST